MKKNEELKDRELDPGMMALEMNKFFESLGYKHIIVYSVKEAREVDITILSGRLRPPSKKDIDRFEDLKLSGVCYTVSRMKRIRPFRIFLKIWDSKNWRNS